MAERSASPFAAEATDRQRAAEELRSLFEEVAEVSWRRPEWRAVVGALAASEALSDRRHSSEAAAGAFVRALEANSSMMADTFIATAGAPPDATLERRVRRAVQRAGSLARTLDRLGDISDDQPLWSTLRLEAGWLRRTKLAGRPRRVVFLNGDGAWLASIDAPAAELEAALWSSLRGGGGGLPPVARGSREATPAAAAIAIDPVASDWARSFHRRGWSRGGGPWMGIADAPPYRVVSTCHAAVDGYVHARVTDGVFSADEATGPSATPLSSFDGSPPRVGFATCDVTPAPRFAVALHAFAQTLDDALGDPGAEVSVPFHVPIAPGRRTDPRRWRQRPIYGLLALPKRSGRLQERAALAARLPGWLAREAAGEGLLARVLRATLELPLPLRARRRLIARRGWTDRFEPARILTGGGYVSWMRFAEGEAPARPLYPSAVPSFAVHRGGAGLSITNVGADGIGVGLTTSGNLASDDAAARFLDRWREALARESP